MSTRKQEIMLFKDHSKPPIEISCGSPMVRMVFLLPRPRHTIFICFFPVKFMCVDGYGRPLLLFFICFISFYFQQNPDSRKEENPDVEMQRAGHLL